MQNDYFILEIEFLKNEILTIAKVASLTLYNLCTALFVLALTFTGKWFIFQRAFSRKLSHFPVFGNDLENELANVF